MSSDVGECLKRRSASGPSRKPGECVYDSQGGFACPGADAYKKAWDAQAAAEACRDAWHDRWIHVGDTPFLTYEMGYVPLSEKTGSKPPTSG